MPRLTIPRSPENVACDRQSRFPRRTRWRPEQEEREVGRSYASGRVCKKNKVYLHSLRKSSEKGNRAESPHPTLKRGEEDSEGREYLRLTSPAPVAPRSQCGRSGERDRPCGLLPRDSRFQGRGAYRAQA